MGASAIVGIVGWSMRPSIATVTTSETFRLATYTDRWWAFARAIASAEGYGVLGSVPSRANNPGDLKLGGETIADGITVYGTAEDGWRALLRQIERMADGSSRIYHAGMTLRDVAARWTTTDAGPWAATVARALGVSVHTTLGEVLG
jgi:hypothetical protein